MMNGKLLYITTYKQDFRFFIPVMTIAAADTRSFAMVTKMVFFILIGDGKVLLTDTSPYRVPMPSILIPEQDFTVKATITTSVL